MRSEVDTRVQSVIARNFKKTKREREKKKLEEIIPEKFPETKTAHSWKILL